MTEHTAVGVYIFAGGFTLGVRDHFKVLAHLEGSLYGVPTVRRNMPGLPIWASVHRWPLQRFRGVDFVYGNPPCAAWSVAGKSMRQGRTNWMADPRVSCTRNLFNVLRVCEPKVWLWESVTQAYTRGMDLVQALSKEAVERGYQVTHLFSSALLHGIPQPRRRFMMVASKVEIDFDKPVGEKPTVGSSLGLTSPDGGSTWVQTCPVWGVPPCSPREEQIIRLTLPGEDMVTGWKRLREIDPAHAGQAPPLFVNRLLFDGCGGTQTSQIMHIHPAFHRYVSDSECARLGSYPDDYVWVPKRPGETRAMIAQAVLPNVGRYVASRIKRGLDAGVAATPGIRVVNHLDLPVGGKL